MTKKRKFTFLASLLFTIFTAHASPMKPIDHGCYITNRIDQSYYFNHSQSSFGERCDGWFYSSGIEAKQKLSESTGRLSSRYIQGKVINTVRKTNTLSSIFSSATKRDKHGQPITNSNGQLNSATGVLLGVSESGLGFYMSLINEEGAFSKALETYKTHNKRFIALNYSGHTGYSVPRNKFVAAQTTTVPITVWLILGFGALAVYSVASRSTKEAV